MASTATALTVADQVDRSPVASMLSAQTTALMSLLPDELAVRRFQRVTLQAIAKNPELLECTPESVILSVMEAAAQGLEPTGAAGGAHLVPFNTKVTDGGRDRWEKRAQLVPDYRGVIRMVTRKGSEVQSMEARVVKEGDDFDYQLGGDSWVEHKPSLSPSRSQKPTTHVYSVARLRAGGAPLYDVMDHAEVEAIRQRGKKRGFSSWDSDWDEMAKKTVTKRHSKFLPVPPEVLGIFAREDALAAGESAPAPVAIATSAPRTKQLAARLRPALVVAEPEQPNPDPAEHDASLFASPEPAEEAAFVETPGLTDKIREAATRSGLVGAVTAPQQARLKAAFAGVPAEVVQRGIHVLFARERFADAAEAQAVITIADSLGDEAFRAEWSALAAS